MYGKLLTAQHVLSIRDRINQAIYTPVYGVIPDRTACPDCLADTAFGGSTDVTCPTCGSTGWVTVSRTSVFMARVRWRMDIVAALPFFRTDIMSADTGDCTLVFRTEERAGVEALLANERVYFLVGSKRLRPKTWNVSELYGDVSFHVFCALEGQSRD